jgi:hypothetical protein
MYPVSRTNTPPRGSVASLVRLKYIPKLTKTSVDFYSDSIGLEIWSGVELALGICAGSLATMRPLLRKVIRGARSFREAHSSRNATETSRFEESQSFQSRPTAQQSRLINSLGSAGSTEKSYYDEAAYGTSGTGDYKPLEIPLQSLEPAALMPPVYVTTSERATRRQGSIASQLQPVSISAPTLARRGTISSNLTGEPQND